MRACVVLALVLAGCARMDYVKVPTPTQYSQWTDQDQRRADGMKGVRYYLPRPFVHLKEPTPVAQRVAFVTFVLKGNQYEFVPPQNPPSWLLRVVPKQVSIRQALAAMLATPSRQDDPPKPGEQQEGTPTEGEGTKRPDAAQAPPTKLTARTGFINQSDPVTHLGSQMDIVYLPDFEEQFVIRPSFGMGQGDVETRLRNGWAAEVFSQQVDNSNLIPYVIRQVEEATQAAGRVAIELSKMGIVTLPTPSGAAKEEAGEVSPERAREVLGDVVLFKVAEIRIAQPGVYPILKPRELRQWLKASTVVSGTDPDDAFELFLQQANTPWIRPDVSFIPCPPFTMVGFNTTTDVLLAPATAAIAQADGPDEQNATPTPENAEATAAKEKIKAALLKDVSALGAQATKVNEQTVEVDSNAAGNATVIRLTNPTMEETPEVRQSIDQWISTALSLAEDSIDPDRITFVKTTAGDSLSHVEVVVPSDLASLAGKVDDAG